MLRRLHNNLELNCHQMCAIEVVLVALCFFYIPYSASSLQACSSSVCSNDTGPSTIQFPFRLNKGQRSGCGYPGFDLWCNDKKQTMLTLPYSGDFTVTNIDYFQHEIHISDPEKCIPKRLLQGFSLSNSSFYTADYEPKNYTFFNCSPESIVPDILRIRCLGGKNYSVTALPPEKVGNIPQLQDCLEIATVLVPKQRFSLDFSDDIELTWNEPECGNCDEQGGDCGFKSDAGPDIGCLNLPSRGDGGLSRRAKYGLIFGIGVPGIICIFVLTRHIIGRRTSNSRGPNHSTVEFTPQPVIVQTGLDSSTIETYPKTVLGESQRQLLNLNDGTCTICLAEYQPNETLRTIPECNHSFHAQCIDEWLGKNVTCPVCRNLPKLPSIESMP